MNVGGVTETNRYFICRHPLEQIEPFLKNTLDNINRIAAQAKDCGAEFVLFVCPRYHHWSQRESPDNWETVKYKTDEPYQYEYFKFFDRERINLPYPVVNMLPAFQATTEFPLCFKADAHWNARGHGFVARFLADYLIASQIVK